MACTLICGSNGRFYNYGSVADGTYCYTDSRKDVCIKGKCRNVGCDLALRSGAVEDQCKVCSGDGSSCKSVTGSTHKTFSWPGDYKVVTIPKGSYKIVVKEMAPTMNFLGVKVGNGRGFIYRVPGWSSTTQAAGATVYYEMKGYVYADKVTIPKTINDDVHIYLVNRYRVQAKGISWTYYTEGKALKSGGQIDYVPVIGKWGACSKTCAEGIQSRTISCHRKIDKSAVSRSYCGKLPTTQACNKSPCPGEWYISQWGQCSKSCAKGTHHRKITCVQLYADGKYRTDQSQASCNKASKPQSAIQKYCNERMCPSKWEVGKWSKCSTTCGKGTKKAAVTCLRINADGNRVSVRDLECIGLQLPKPLSIMPCTDDSICPTWKISYSNCSVACGKGVRSPLVVCMQNEIKMDSSKCRTKSKPDISKIKPKTCTNTCTYKWERKVGSCSVSCGTGILPVSVTCVRIKDRKTIPDSLCAANSKKPSSVSESCDAGECLVLYNWKISYTKCSATCGKGMKSVILDCINQKTNRNTSFSLCDPATKPSGNSISCNAQKCSERYLWEFKYGACSVTCGKGIHRPNLNCVRSSDKTAVHTSQCDKDDMPHPKTKHCHKADCPLIHAWKTRYSTCSKTCGEGIKVGYMHCIRGTDNKILADSFCADLQKPDAKNVTCKTANCIRQYRWKSSNGACSRTCGKGYRLKELHCYNDTKEVDHSNCFDEQPPIPKTVACNMRECPAVFPKDHSVDKFFSVGCFKDNTTYRRVPFLLKDLRKEIIWSDLTKTILACAKVAMEQNMTYFSIQNYGQCYGGTNSTRSTFWKSGPSKYCTKGVGARSEVNYIYHFRQPTPPVKMEPVIPLGCFKDAHKTIRPLPYSLGNFRAQINWHDMTKTIGKCAKMARLSSFPVFGIEFYGECWAAKNDTYYAIDGTAFNCYRGTGGANTIYAYKFYKHH